MTEQTRQPITIDEIKKRAEGIVIEIPDWVPQQTIYVRVKGVDMTPYLMEIEKLPNPLKTAAVESFQGKASAQKSDQIAGVVSERDMDSATIEAMLPLLEGIAKDVLVEPTYDEIVEHYPLTLSQKMALFQFAMGGIDSLESFRSGFQQDGGVDSSLADV